MKTTFKILILLLAITSAIGGVMVYAKTKVSPPITLGQIDQYGIDLKSLVPEFSETNGAKSEDYLLAKWLDRIHLFYKEGKIDEATTDRSLDQIVGYYSPKFINRCLAEFRKSDWKKDTHEYILSQSELLKNIHHIDNTSVITKNTDDSLRLLSSIISDFREAQRISRKTTFTGYNSARTTISLARKYVGDAYLSNCRRLVNDLNLIKTRLANSCYNQVLWKINQLSWYRDYTEDYFKNTLVREVVEKINAYDRNAAGVFGKKENVEELWSKLYQYCKEAMTYYEEELRKTQRRKY